MSRERIHLYSRQWDQHHQERRIAKVQRIQGLRALLEMWEQNPNCDHEYLLKLKARLRSAENQYAAMKV